MEIKNNTFQRILSNVIGQVVTAEEMEAVTGAAIKLPNRDCSGRGYVTQIIVGNEPELVCDE